MTSQNSECNMKISKVIIVINRTKPHARQTGSALKAFLDRERVRQEWLKPCRRERTSSESWRIFAMKSFSRFTRTQTT